MHKYWRFVSIFLLGIVLLSVVCLRFFKLGDIPHGINVDEASYAYDSYSLLKTGKDMWGNAGSSLKSFGDYKPAGLAVTAIPVEKIFGLNTFSIRLPSAFFGFLTLIVTFFLLQYIFGNNIFAFVGTILLGLSPWHFGLSRLFYEPNIGLFFIVCGIFCEIAYMRNPGKPKYIIAASGLTAVGGFYYAVLRYLGVGLIAIAVSIAQSGNVRKIFRFGLIAALAWVLAASPYLGDMFGAKGVIRLRQESSLHNFGNSLVVDENRQMCYISSGYNPTVAKLCYVLWNKPGETLVNAAKVYVQLLSPKYLFLNGYQKDVIPESYGAFLEILLPFYLIGLFTLLTNIKKKENLYLILSLLFTTLPIALAGALNIHRNVVGLLLVFLIIQSGIFAFTKWVGEMKNSSIKCLLALLMVAAVFWSQARYIANYFFVFTRLQPEVWQYETPEVMSWLGTNAGDKQIYFYDYDFAPLYYAVFTRLDPHTFQTQTEWAELNQYGWTNPRRIGQIVEMRSDFWQDVCLHAKKGISSKLLIVTPKPELKDIAVAEFQNFTGIHILRQVYDSQKVYDFITSSKLPELNLKCSLYTKTNK